MEALWPVLRKFASQDAERGPGRIWPAFEEQVRHLYLESGNATLIARGRALLADVQPDPNRREGGDRVSRHLVDKPKERVGGVFSRSTGKPPAKMPAPSKMPAPPAILPMSAEVKEVRGYVARGVNLLSGEGRGACPFVRAIEEEKWQLVVAMVETGLDVRAEVEWRGTAETVGGLALYAALAAERYDLAKQLVERGVKLRERAGSWSVSGSALYLALRSMDAGLSRAVLQMEPTVDISECPLNAVVDVGDVALLKELLERLRRMAGDQREFREWVDHGGIGKESPLWRATKAGWRDGVEILLAEGANTNPSPVAGRTLRDDAIGAPELAVLLNRRPGAPDNQLAGATAMAMVEKDDPALATLILDAAVLRYRDLRGASVLHFACTKHREAFARRLIAAGASVDAVNVKDCQPLHIAANEGLSDLVGALLAVGAPINHPSSDGVTPLHFAALNGDSATIRCLLKAGADQAYREVGGATPLLMAANSPKALEAMRVFVEAGASLQDVDYWRLGLLERVVFSDDPAAIQFLLDHGVQWRRPWPTKDYVHPLLAAVKNGKPRSVQKLLELGLYDDRALAFAKSGEIRLLLEDASRQLGTRAVDDAELWPKICADLSHGAERAKDHVSRGGNVNYDGGRWSPLWLAVKERNVPLARLLVLSGANRDWYPPGLESSPILGNVINRPPWGGAASEMAVFDAECAELVAMMVTPENAAAYRWTLSSGVHNLLPRTVRALVAAGVPSAEEIEGIRKASWLSEEEKQARLGLFDQ
jgi:ankyrin repeat protein